MKIFFILVLLASNATAQNKKDNTIIISESISMEKIKSVLFENGYSLINNDSTYITTTSKELSNSAPMAVKLMILRKDSTYIKGLYKPTISLSFQGTKIESDFDHIYFGGERNSPFRKTWIEMDRVARLLSANITYAKR